MANVNSNEATLEQRLETVEQAIVDLQRRLDDALLPANRLDKVIGSITDKEAFLEALQYGRAFRMSDRPQDEADDPS